MATADERKQQFPRISILMATYDPRLDWLREQLNSLNQQTYPNLYLYIRDDCSPTISFESIQRLAEEHITAFPFEICKNEKNMGSNLTFEALTETAKGDYFAYCDQDDIWMPEKLEKLMNHIRQENAKLICSDMLIIDGHGVQTAESITQVRKHHVFRSGEGLAPQLIVSNFVTGCTMMMPSTVAKEAVPFCPYMVHDQYLAFYAASRGKIVSLEEPLIRYRIHQSNQTLAMAGVHDKQSYYMKRILLMKERAEWLAAHYKDDPILEPVLRDACIWANARVRNYQGDKAAKREIWKHRRFSPLTSLLEISMIQAPEKLFMFFVEMKRKNIV